jgi:CheY-like chemotaxis protein/signal transduction histidine kinase/HAMP domain-containing protein
MKKPLTIGQKLWIAFGIMIFLTVAVGISGLLKMEALADLTGKIFRHPFTVSNTVRDIRSNIVAMRTSMRDVILAANIAQLEREAAAVDEKAKEVLQSFELVIERFLGNPEDVRQARTAFIDWKVILDQVINLLRAGDREKAVNILKGEGTRQVEEMNRKIQVMIDFAGHKAERFMADARNTRQQAWVFMILLIFAACACGVMVSLFVVQSVVRPVKRLTRLSADIADGVAVAAQQVNRYDELGLLIRSFNRIIDSNNRYISQAKAISSGDYSLAVELRSEFDELGLALQNMKQSLQDARQANEEQSWLKSGRNELSDQMQGDLEISILARNVVTFLAKFLEAQIGAFYLADLEGQELQLAAGYALAGSNSRNGKIKIGEGFVGQAAFEGEIMSITDVPQDYFRIESSTGSAPPGHIVVVPLKYRQRLAGVIELGFFKKPSALIYGFLNRVAENIAIELNSAQSRHKMAALLDESRQQAHQLRQQREELQQTNAELEAQSQALSISEAKLQAQQEEMRQTNEELEKQAAELEQQAFLLENQKNDIAAKNRQLEQSRALLEQKAEDLRLSGNYKSEFLANMSHELRTPMNSILLLSKVLADNKDANLTPKQIEFSQTIHSAGSDLLNLINDVLDLSKVESGKMQLLTEEVSPAAIADHMQRIFQPLAQEKGLIFEVKLAQDLPRHIYTDRLRAEQIIKNLLSNALKFTDQGKIALYVSRPGQSTLRNGDDPDSAGTIAFEVSDTGIGIPQSQQKRIFEAFQQCDGSTNRKYGGTGLGLSISLGLARLLGGEITIQSREGRGSVFTLFLPQQREPARNEAGDAPVEIVPQDSAAAAALEPAPAVAAAWQATAAINGLDELQDDRRNLTPDEKSILIIEDDPRFAKFLLDLSHEKDFKVILAGNGETGLHFATYYKPSAIILDISLPGMDGWTVMSRLKDDLGTRHIPVHIISVAAKNVDAMKMGAIGFLSKPVTMENLNQVFGKIENVISNPIKHLLVVEDDEAQRKSIIEFLGDNRVEITSAATGQEAWDRLHERRFDCMILDLGLPDMSGVDFIYKMKNHSELHDLPVIVYTGKDLTQEEQVIINDCAEKIIIKGAKSPEKLIDDTTLFLHRVQTDLPAEKQRILRMVHDRDAILKDKKILLVDDDMRNIYALSSILEENGMQVLAGKNGREGLECLVQNPDIDIVLMDIMMPEMDGYTAIKKIRQQKIFKKLPVIALTAKAMKGDRAKCIDAGANDYVAKPVDAEKLLSLLRVWLY